MEVLCKELAYAENVLKKDPNLSTLEGLVHLVVETTIQLKALEIALDNWDSSLKIIMEVNKFFGSIFHSILGPFDISIKKEEIIYYVDKERNK